MSPLQQLELLLWKLASNPWSDLCLFLCGEDLSLFLFLFLVAQSGDCPWFARTRTGSAGDVGGVDGGASAVLNRFLGNLRATLQINLRQRSGSHKHLTPELNFQSWDPSVNLVGGNWETC